LTEFEHPAIKYFTGKANEKRWLNESLNVDWIVEKLLKNCFFLLFFTTSIYATTE
jgi:hypothetical protein